jgi:hypothetical protein
MQLRKSITAPARLEDEEPATPRNRDITKPAFPDSTKATAVPFNPDNSPAAFPSLPLSKVRPVTNITEGVQTTIELGKTAINEDHQATTDDSTETTINDSQKTIAGEPTTRNSLSESLAGNSSDDDGQTSHSDFTFVQDSNQQDKESNSVVARGPTTRNRSRTANSSSTATQVSQPYAFIEPETKSC